MRTSTVQAHVWSQIAPGAIFGAGHFARWMAVIVSSAMLTVTALAGPAGENIVHGQGQVSRPDNITTVIDQHSQQLGINWETFNVQVNEHVIFNQPSADSLALNRIFDQNPSQIFGAIDANGNVLLINPNGMVFGPDAQLNIHSLVASSLELSMDDFRDGNYSLHVLADQRGGVIVNHGVIEAAAGGAVTLIGDSVINTGLILADYGSVSLAAGEKATLDFVGDGLMLFSVDEALTLNTTAQEAAVLNSGTIQADGGRVLLTASTARDVFSSVVNNEGVIKANRLEAVGGIVHLFGGGGTVRHSGSIDASSANGVGGNVQILGDRVGLFDDAKVDASGRDGGGEVLIGGDLHGANARVVNAERTYLSSGSQVRADATGNGDGGKVVVWSDESSRVYGELSARGGAGGGNGGLIETSGKTSLEVARAVDVSAARGNGGEWLIDPNNLDIVAGSGNTNINPANPFATTNDGASLGVDLITAALAGGANVTVQTGSGGSNMEAGNITLGAGVTLDFDNAGANAGASLMLLAENDIVINGSITDSVADADSLNLSLNANTGVDDPTSGDVIIGATGVINLGGGAFTTSGIDFTNDGTVDTQSGDVTLLHDGDFVNSGTIDGGLFSITAGQNGSGATVTVGGTIIATTPVDIDGGPGADTFDIDVFGFDGVINGGGGDDTFNILAAVTGSLLGSGGDDTFRLFPGSSATTIDGGIASETMGDVLDVSAISGGVLVDLASATLVGPVGGTFVGIETFTGGDSASTNAFTLYGGSDWDITGANDGLVDGLSFVDFGNLTGTAGEDSFDFGPAGSLSGLIDGLGGADMANWALAAPQTVTLGDDVANVETLTGGGTGFTLAGGNDFDITGVNDGSVDTLNFVDFANLTGTAGDDSFDFGPAGSLSGLIDGLGGADMANWALAAPQTVTVFTDVVGVETLTGGGVGFTLAGGSDWVITGVNDGSVDTLNFVDFANLSGTAGGDTFAFTTGSIDGDLDGLADIDELDLSATINAAVDLETVTTDAIGGTFANVETLTGNASSTLLSGAGDDAWQFSSPNAGTVGFYDFRDFGTHDAGAGTDVGDYSGMGAGTVNIGALAGFEILVGNEFATLSSGPADDHWILNDSGLTGTVDVGGNGATITFQDFGMLDAGAGSDAVTNTQASNIWLISPAGTVSVFGGAGVSNIEIINAGEGDDTFNIDGPFGLINGAAGDDVFRLFANAATATGTIDGGAGSDSLTGSDTTNAWLLNAADAGTLNDVSFSAIEYLTGGAGEDEFTLSGGTLSGDIDGAGGTDSLVGDNTANTWLLSSAASGLVTGVGGEFRNIDRLVGGAMDDVFNVSASFAGDLNGGAGEDRFLLTGGSIVGGRIDGGADADLLTGDDTHNEWSILRPDGGTLNLMFFSGVENLEGGALTDAFDFESVLTGTANGGDGDDVFEIHGGSVGAVDGGSGFDALYGDNTANVWVIDADNAGLLNGLPFASVENLFGNAGSDDFALTGGTLSGVIYGGPGNNSLTAGDFANSWILNNVAGDSASGTVTGVGGLFFGITDVIGGAATDEFNVSETFTGNISGGLGDDVFVLADGSSVTGIVHGGAGRDTLNWMPYLSPRTLLVTELGTVDGFAGRESMGSVAGFDNINEFVYSGTGDTVFVVKHIRPLFEQYTSTSATVTFPFAGVWDGNGNQQYPMIFRLTTPAITSVK